MATILNTISSLFTRKKKNEGVVITVEPSQTTYNPNTGELVNYRQNPSGGIDVVGQSTANPPAYMRPVRHSGGSSHSSGGSTASSSSSFIQTGSPEPNAYGAEAITAAPTFKQQLMSKGGYTFYPNLMIQKTVGKLGDWEQMNTKGGNMLFAGETGSRISKIAEGSQYFIPGYGQVLGIAQGIEYLSRPKNYVGQGWKGAEGVGLSVLGITGGAAGLKYLKGATKETSVLSSTRTINQADNIIISNTIAEAKNIKFLTDDTLLNAIQTQTKIEPIADDLFKFEAISKGASRSYRGSAPFIGEVYSKPTPFVGVTTGLIKTDNVALSSKTLNVNTILFGGKTQTGRQATANFLDDLSLSGKKLQGISEPSTFTGGGVSIIDDEVALTYSKFKQIKDGRLSGPEIKSLDIAKQAKKISDDSFNVVTRGSTTSKLRPSINTDALQSQIDRAIITNIVKNPSKTAKPYFRGGASSGMFEPDQALRETNKIINNQMQLQNDSDLQKLFTMPKVDFIDLDNQRDSHAFRNPQRAEESLLSGSAEAVAQIERQVTKQMERTITNFIPHRNVPFNTGIAGLPLPLIDIDDNRKKRRGSRLNPAYRLQVKRKGKFYDVLGGLTHGRAKAIGASLVSKELSRTFRLLPSGVTSEPDFNFNLGKEFRRPKRGNDIDTFIQKTEFSLSSPEEKFLLKKSRKNKQNVFSGLIS